jgi:hypothetical protein
MTGIPGISRVMHEVRRVVLHGAAACTLILAIAGSASAQSYTLADIFARIRTADSAAHFATVNPMVHNRIDSLERYVRDHGALEMTIDELSDVYLGATPGYATVLRWNRGSYPALPSDFKDSLGSIRKVAGVPLRTAAEQAMGAAALDTLYRPLDLWYADMLNRAIAKNGDLLRRYSVKYGPESPRLNLAEAALNYFVQLPKGSPFAGNDSGPSPLELVASYRTTDLTASRAAADSALNLKIVTTAQLGMRFYRFKSPTCGQGNQLDKLRNPCYFVLGLFLMGPKDTPLQQLWKGSARKGFYAGVSNYHAGVVFGQEKRFVFGIDTQVLPYVF